MAQREQPGSRGAHLTSRRGFLLGTGFSVLSLYGLWAAYGAAPVPFMGGDHDHAGGGHAGHGRGALTPDAFQALAEEFLSIHGQADGSVRPLRAAPAAAGGEHAGHAMPGESPAGPIDLYLMAQRYGYVPGTLHLVAGEAYRLRVMAMDTGHGASIALGPGGRIIRAPARVAVEVPLSFRRAGEYLIYCTVYCGDGHDRMSGRIIVASSSGQ